MNKIVIPSNSLVIARKYIIPPDTIISLPADCTLRIL